MAIQYSQIAQELWVLHHTSHKHGGTFVDIGAHDGIHFSNTYSLEQDHGWHGVCVEPHPQSFEQLRLNRECHTLPYACWSKSGVRVPFHLHGEHAMLSGIAHSGDCIQVETRSLTDVIDEAGLGQEIDYISIDTEGSELEILSGFDWSRHHVKCWSVEHNYKSHDVNAMIDMFSQHGYLWRLWYWDILAVHDDAFLGHVMVPGEASEQVGGSNGN